MLRYDLYGQITIHAFKTPLHDVLYADAEFSRYANDVELVRHSRASFVKTPRSLVEAANDLAHFLLGYPLPIGG